MKAVIGPLFAIALFASSGFAKSATSDWLEAPRPAYPLRAALEGAAGEVKLRVLLKSNGRVQDATVTKSSGKAVLDHAARAAVLNWRLNPLAAMAK